LCGWMERKGFATVDELRGMLSVPSGADEAARERADYVSALREANVSAEGAWRGADA
jgi:dihydroorotate dehydrogenase (fumarate)